MKQFSSCLSSRSNYKGLNLFFTFLAFFLFSSLFVFPLQNGHCNQVTLTWDPNTEPDLAGYEIYYGTSPGNYQRNIDIGNVTNYTLYGLNVGVTYYIAATAYNTQGLQSGYSNEVVYTIPSCTYTISPSSATFSSLGGSGSVLVTTQAGCNWGTSASIPWITVTSGSGMASGTISYTVSPNIGAIRTAGFTIAGNIFTVTEAGLSAYVITASAGAGGSISPSGQISILAGAGQTFTITPNTGYQIADVMVDGVSQGSITSYTFSSVSVNHTITAFFRSNSSTTYTLSVSNNGTGKGSVSVNPSGTSFGAGTQVTLTATPDANSIFSGWSGGCSGTTLSCQVTMNSNLSVVATYSVDAKTPVVTTGSASSVTLSSVTLNGTVNPNGLPTTYIFEWGTTSSYGNLTAIQSAGSGTTNVAATANLTDLAANTLHHYRLVATNSAGTTEGADTIFVAQHTDKVDFDNDGKTDLLWRNDQNGQIAVWYMNGITPTRSTVIAPGYDTNWELIGTGDFKGDGSTDILWRHQVTGQLSLRLIHGETSTAQGSPGTVDRDWEIKGIGDFNGDGKADILWRHRVTGQLYVWLMNGETPIAQGSPETVDQGWEIKGVGDFNGDGKADILWRHRVTGQLYVWLMNGTTIASMGSPGTISDPSWKIKGVSDFNGDGKADILWRNEVSGQLYVWLMDGTAIASQGSPGTVDRSWEIKGLGDFNGDGKVDIVWRHNLSGMLYVWIMNGTIVSSTGSPGTVSDSHWTIVTPL